MSEAVVTSPTHWSSIREAGTLLGLKFLWLVHRVLGRKVLSLMLIPTVAYFLTFRSETRESSRQFLLAHYRQYPDYWKARPRLWNSARHFKEFSEVVVDKLLSWSVDIDADQFEIRDEEYLEKLMVDPSGRLVIGSHFGNLEYCRGFVHRYRNRVINILIHDAHTQNYNNMMRLMNPESRLNIMQVTEFDIPTMLKIKQKVDNGEWIFIAGDRCPPSGSARTVNVRFLGKTAALPIGPYMLAKALACPVELIFSFCDYANDHLVTVDLIKFADVIELDRKNRQQQLQLLAQKYADELEKQCATHPFQWFNFYDFWASHV